MIDKESLDRLASSPWVAESRRTFSDTRRKVVAFYVGSLIDREGLTGDEITERCLLAADLALYGAILSRNPGAHDDALDKVIAHFREESA